MLYGLRKAGGVRHLLSLVALVRSGRWHRRRPIGGEPDIAYVRADTQNGRYE